MDDRVRPRAALLAHLGDGGARGPLGRRLPGRQQGRGGESGEAGEPADLLVLDPAMAPIPLVPWNAMLAGWATKQPRRVVATFSERVNIDAVLVLSPVAQAQEDE